MTHTALLIYHTWYVFAWNEYDPVPLIHWNPQGTYLKILLSMLIQITARTEHVKRTKAYATYLNTLDYTPYKWTHQTKLFRHSSDNAHKQVYDLQQVDLDPSLCMTSHPADCQLIADYIGAPGHFSSLSLSHAYFFVHIPRHFSVSRILIVFV